MQPIYLDYAASTPLDQRVLEKMWECLSSADLFANPSSLHVYGLKAKDLIESARTQLAACIQAEPAELIFTSGATESNNLAIKGAAQLYQSKGRHIITMKTEHKAVLDCCMQLEKEGCQLTYLNPMNNGLLDLNEFQAAIRPDTVLASIMHVNNETGIVQDIAAIAKLTAARGVLLHVDAAQSLGKLPLNMKAVPIDLLSICAHKAYGPKGIGALYLRKKPRVRVQPLFHGGGHEQGMRSGTLATHQIVGFAYAAHLAEEERAINYQGISQLSMQFLQGLKAFKQICLNTDTALSVPHILNLRFDGMLADAILAKLTEIAASTASACQGKGIEGSYVLRAMGLSSEQIKSSIRLSFGRFTRAADIEKTLDAIQHLLA